MANRIALPPGVYFVRTADGLDGLDMVNAAVDNGPLTVAAQQNIPSHRWLISGNGIMRAMDVVAGRFVSANLAPAVVPQAVTRGLHTLEWIINVSRVDVPLNSFAGTIIAIDSWGRRVVHNGDNVELSDPLAAGQNWTFVPV